MWYCKTLYLTVMQISCSNIHSPEFQSGTCRWPQVSNLVCDRGQNNRPFENTGKITFLQDKGRWFQPTAAICLTSCAIWPVTNCSGKRTVHTCNIDQVQTQCTIEICRLRAILTNCTYMLLTNYRAIAKHYSLGLQASSKLAIIFPRKPFCL